MPLTSPTTLRRAERDDLDRVIEWMEDPDFQHFLYGDAAQSPRQVRENIVAMLGRSPSNMVPGSIHLIIDHAQHGPIGLISLQKISWRNRSCMLDLYIAKERRTTMESGAAMYRAFEYCFDELNLHRVGAIIYSFNKPSWRFFERTGAKRELTLKDHVVRDGALHDMYSYGLLKHEFEAFREEATHFRAMSLEAMIERALAQQDASSPPT
jgi:ribosomal-protein-alanine N-acetyltransferase